MRIYTGTAEDQQANNSRLHVHMIRHHVTSGKRFHSEFFFDIQSVMFILTHVGAPISDNGLASFIRTPCWDQGWFKKYIYFLNEDKLVPSEAIKHKMNPLNVSSTPITAVSILSSCCFPFNPQKPPGLMSAPALMRAWRPCTSTRQNTSRRSEPELWTELSGGPLTFCYVSLTGAASCLITA